GELEPGLIHQCRRAQRCARVSPAHARSEAAKLLIGDAEQVVEGARISGRGTAVTREGCALQPISPAHDGNPAKAAQCSAELPASSRRAPWSDLVWHPRRLAQPCPGK